MAAVTLGEGYIEWCPIGRGDWGKKLKVCLLTVKMTTPWTGLQTHE